MSNQESRISSSRKCSTQPTLINSNDKIKKKKKKKKNNLRKQQQQQEESPRRSPLQDYLNIPISRTNSNSSSLSSSTSISIEAPFGCLNFFSKTPLNTSTRPTRNPPKPNRFLSNKNPKKSPPNPKENRLPQKSKKPIPCLYQWQSSKRTTGSTKAKTSPDFQNHQEEHQGKCYSGELFNFPGFTNAPCGSDNLVVEECTPVGKLVIGSGLKSGNGKDDCKSIGEKSNTTGTPPIQSSLSPEIQCGSSVLVSGATPSTATCYGAGHVVSGVTDRRKCRPRGTLIVGTSQSSECPEPGKDGFDGMNDENHVGVVRKSRPSFIPLPAEASMSWNLSPSQEVEGGSMKGEHVVNGLGQSGSLVSSATRNVPSLPGRFDSNMFRYANYSGTSNPDIESGRKTRITLLSPTGLPEFQGFSGPLSEKVARRPSSASPCATPKITQEERSSSQYNFTDETSPFSLDSLGDGNVIQTPKSDSSKGRHVGRSWLDELRDQKESLEYELESVSELLEQASLSPWSQTSPWVPLGVSSKLSDLNSPSNSVGFNQLQKSCGRRASCFSSSTFEDVSQSQMRISWRDGLVSRMFEMDDLDSCRLLSDEENEADGYDNDLLESHPTKIFTFEAPNDDCQFSNDGLRSPEFLEHEVEVDRKGKTFVSPNQSNSCAESICTDGGRLVASEDADWTLCYKNHLFEV